MTVKLKRYCNGAKNILNLIIYFIFHTIFRIANPIIHTHYFQEKEKLVVSLDSKSKFSDIHFLK